MASKTVASGSSWPPLPALRSNGSGACRKSSAETELEAEAAAHCRHGRRFEEMREMFLKANCLASNASGSAYVSLGHTKIYSAVHGPRPLVKGKHFAGSHDQGELLLDLKVAQFARQDRVGQSETDQRTTADLTQALESVVMLEKYPKSVIEICVLVLEDDGGMISCALTCIGLALADAGIQMIDIIAGASVYAVPLKAAIQLWPTILPDESKASACGQEAERVVSLLDMRAEEIEYFERLGTLTSLHLGLCPGRDSICFLSAVGPHLAEPQDEHLLAFAEAACRSIGDEIRRCLSHSYISKEAKKADEIGLPADADISPDMNTIEVADVQMAEG